ncbi:MAG: hypothetical protein SVM86_08425, partial [Candidatus Cloacimonadota bacterium]|nr:hypothetical protein [Candidatus Cloacimonadota bacterium]
YPQWRQQYNLGISYNLPYNNSVNLNFIYQNFQKFSTSGADLLNTRLSLDITKNFDIKAEVINILGEKSIKDYTLSSTHYILGVNWYFLN